MKESRFFKYAALALRIILALLVVYDFARGAKLAASFFAVVWIVLLVLAIAGRRSPGYQMIDSMLLAFFIFFIFSSFFGLNLESSVLGPDKIFHTAGGALLGIAGIILLRPYIKNDFALASVAILFALAIGAGWEVFEWIYHKIAPVMMATTYDDTMLDLVADTLGAFIAASVWYVWRRK